MERAILTFITLIGIQFTLSSANAEPLTLSSAVDQALQKSPLVQRAQSSALQASWQKTAAYSGFLPSVNLSETYFTSQKFMFTDLAFPGTSNLISIPNLVPSSEVALTARMPLFDGFANWNHLSAAASLEHAAGEELTWSQFKLERQVTLQFYRALATRILKEVAERNMQTIEDHLRDVTLFKRAGVSTNYDVLRVEVQVSEAKSDLLNSQDNVEVAKNELAELLGEDSETRELSGELPVLKRQVIQKLEIDDISQRADIRGLSFRASGLESEQHAANRFWVPRLDLVGQFDYYNNLSQRFDDWQNYRTAYQVGFVLSWNLFDGLVSIAKAHESNEQRYQAEKNLEIERLKAKKDLEYWKRKYLYFCSVYESRVSDVQKSTESVRLAREGRRAGSRTNSDLLDAELELFRARAGVVNAQIGAVEALINLELATGKQLYRFNSEDASWKDVK